MRPAGKRRGITLLELLVALSIGVLVLGVTWRVLISGSRLFSRGVSAVRGPEAAILLVDRLEEDLVQCLQVPGDPRPPLAIEAGRRIAFYRPDPELGSGASVVGVPRLWDLVETASGTGTFHPVRDGQVFREIELRGWSAELVPPDLAERRLGWFVDLRFRFEAAGLRGGEHTVRRLVHLPQPSSNFLHFLGTGGDLLPGLVQMVAPPRDQPIFRTLGPPGEGGEP